MLKWKSLVIVGILAVLGATTARADSFAFTASLDGIQEVPPVATPGSGSAQVVLDDVASTITVNLSFADLLAGAIAAHIHFGPVGLNGPIIFPLFLGAAAGLTTGSIPEQVFLITPAQTLDLTAGLLYVNVHTPLFPGGEIRGQLLPRPTQPIPEPATLMLLGSGLIGLTGFGRKRSSRRA